MEWLNLTKDHEPIKFVGCEFLNIIVTKNNHIYRFEFRGNFITSKGHFYIKDFMPVVFPEYENEEMDYDRQIKSDEEMNEMLRSRRQELP